jgi:hypothetical protein
VKASGPPPGIDPVGATFAGTDSGWRACKRALPVRNISQGQPMVRNLFFLIAVVWFCIVFGAIIYVIFH